MPATPAHARGIARLLGGPVDPLAPRILFRVAGREVPASDSVAFRAPLDPNAVAAGTVSVMRARPALLVPGTEWDARGLHVGAFVTADGTEYVIASVERDESGLIEATLRESR